MNQTIDLNSDLGEDETPEGIARDLAMMRVVSRCNIACGSHAGSPDNMRRMLAAAKAHGVAAGAHPSYPDRQNFGRVSMAIDHRLLRESLIAQIELLAELARDMRVPLQHLKPHGALYNDAQDDAALAKLLATLAAQYGLALVGMAGSQCEAAAHNYGVKYIAEAFVDRAYDARMRLVSRAQAGAVIADEAARVAQALALAKGAAITAIDGQPIHVPTATLCLHSDSKGALESAIALRSALAQAGFTISAAPC